MRLSAKNARDGYLLIAPVLLGCLIFYALPFLLVVYYSMTRGIGINRTFSGLDNYRMILNNEMFRLAFGNTMRFLAVSLPLMLAISYAIALLLKEQAQKHKLLKSVLLFPYIMPVVGTVLLVDLLFAHGGLMDRTAAVLGLPLTDWLGSPWAFWIVVALYLWKNVGYSVILLLSGLVMIPDDHYAAANLDGATALQQFRYITVPQMWYSVFFVIVFSLINAFKCFREIFLIGGTHPNENIYMLQHFINNSFGNLNYAKLSVASVLLLVVVVSAFALLYGWVTRKEAYKL